MLPESWVIRHQPQNQLNNWRWRWLVLRCKKKTKQNPDPSVTQVSQGSMHPLLSFLLTSRPYIRSHASWLSLLFCMTAFNTTSQCIVINSAATWTSSSSPLALTDNGEFVRRAAEVCSIWRGSPQLYWGVAALQQWRSTAHLHTALPRPGAVSW